MKRVIASGAAGLVFGVGLVVSGMTDPDKVIRFLDVGGDWDPSLGLVMAGAIAVHAVLYRLILRRGGPILGGAFGIPRRTDIDARLVVGSALFGAGWGLGGYCPGPGLVGAASLQGAPWVFLAALTGGMLLFHLVEVGLQGSAAGVAVTPTAVPRVDPRSLQGGR